MECPDDKVAQQAPNKETAGLPGRVRERTMKYQLVSRSAMGECGAPDEVGIAVSTFSNHESRSRSRIGQLGIPASIGPPVAEPMPPPTPLSVHPSIAGLAVTSALVALVLL